MLEEQESWRARVSRTVGLEVQGEGRGSRLSIACAFWVYAYACAHARRVGGTRVT